MMGEIAQQLKGSPVVIPAVRSDCRFHLYCSPHNPGAAAVAAELQSYFPALSWTEKEHELEACEHMIIHLTDQTWTRGEASAALAHEVCEAMRHGVHRLLVHEVPGVRCDDERHACSFAALIGETPAHLSAAGPARIYNEIAMNLAEGEWREAGLLKMGQQLAKGSATRERWRCELVEPGSLPSDGAASSDAGGEHALAARPEAGAAARGLWLSALRQGGLPREVMRKDRLLERDDAEMGRVVGKEALIEMQGRDSRHARDSARDSAPRDSASYSSRRSEHI